MKFLTLVFTFFMMIPFSGVYAQNGLEGSSVTSNSSTYESLKQTIEELEALRDATAAKIAALEACGDTQQFYDVILGVCKPVITENDPEILEHSRDGSTGDITNNCPDENDVQYYDLVGSEWTCEQKGP